MCLQFGCVIFGKRILAQKLLIKCWWNWNLVVEVLTHFWIMLIFSNPVETKLTSLSVLTQRKPFLIGNNLAYPTFNYPLQNVYLPSTLSILEPMKIHSLLLSLTLILPCGAFTFSRMTLSRMTLSRMTLSRMTLSRMTLSRMTFSRRTLSHSDLWIST